MNERIAQAFGLLPNYLAQHVLLSAAALALGVALSLPLAVLASRYARIRWPILAGIFILALAIVYRYAPDRTEPKWQWISWGAAAATALWLAGSIGFTIYVSKVGSYDKTYGSLGAVIILLLWFYLTAYVILAGAGLNAEIERQSRRGAALTPQPAATDIRSARGSAGDRERDRVLSPKSGGFY